MDKDVKQVKDQVVGVLERVLEGLTRQYNLGADINNYIEEDEVFNHASKYPKFIYHDSMYDDMFYPSRENLGEQSDLSKLVFTPNFFDRFKIYFDSLSFLFEDTETNRKSLYIHIDPQAHIHIDPQAQSPEDISSERLFSIFKRMFESKKDKFAKELSYLGELQSFQPDEETKKSILSEGILKEFYALFTKDENACGFYFDTKIHGEHDIFSSSFQLAIDTTFENMVITVKDIINVLKED